MFNIFAESGSKGNSLIISQQSSTLAEKKQNQNEIYCVLCKKKYEIAEYKCHVKLHKREPKPIVFENRPNTNIAGKQVEKSIIIQQFKSQVASRYTDDFTIQHNKKDLFQHKVQLSSLSKIEIGHNLSENPEIFKEKQSLIFSLNSSKIIEPETRQVNSILPKKSPFQYASRLTDFKRYDLRESQVSNRSNDKLEHKLRPRNMFAQTH